jgi:hypothetical protein
VRLDAAGRCVFVVSSTTDRALTERSLGLAQARMVRRAVPVALALTAGMTVAGSAAETKGGVPQEHRLIGKWYNGLPSGQYIRFQFTDVGAYAYSSPVRSTSGTFAVANDQLTLTTSDGSVNRYTFRFECIGTGSFSEYLTLRDNATQLEMPYTREPTDPGRRCK